MASMEKPLVWLEGEVKSPPFSQAARLEADYILQQLHKGDHLACLIPVQCHRLGAGATSSELPTNGTLGELSIETIRMRL